MALIVCPECEGKVSDLAQSCPHCGFPISRIIEENSGKVSNSLEVGSKISLGKYRYDMIESNLMEIQWIVLKNVGKYCLILSDCCIDYKLYNQNISNFSWKTSDIRKWLNEVFFNNAFSSSEKLLIADVAEVQSKTKCYSDNDSIQLEDKVFLLSLSEIKETAKKIPKIVLDVEDTKYVETKRRGTKDADIVKIMREKDRVKRRELEKQEHPEYVMAERGSWWLRSTYSPLFLTFAHERRLPTSKPIPCGIRPALWLKQPN